MSWFQQPTESAIFRHVVVIGRPLRRPPSGVSCSAAVATRCPVTATPEAAGKALFKLMPLILTGHGSN